MHQHETTREGVPREEQDALWDLLVAEVPELGQVVAYLREDHGDVHKALVADDAEALRRAFGAHHGRYNQIGRRLPVQIQTEAQIRAWLESTELWADVLANREELLRGAHRGEIISLLLEGRRVVPLTPEVTKIAEEQRRPSPRRLRHAFRWMLGGLLTLGLVRSSPPGAKDAVPLPKGTVEQMAAKVLASPTPTARPRQTPRPVASVLPKPTSTLAPELARLIRPTADRQAKQAKVATPTPSPKTSTAPPQASGAPSATPVASGTPTTAPSPTAKPFTRLAEDFFARTVTSLLSGMSPRASMDRPREGAEELVYAYLSPAAPFVALAVPHAPLKGWAPLRAPGAKSPVLHRVRQESLPSGSFVLHIPGTVPDPTSFRDKAGKPLPVTLEEDGEGNVRVHLSASGPVSYDLVAREETGETYTPAPVSRHTWSAQTQDILRRARGLPAAEAVEFLRRYIVGNGTYSTNPEHFAAYARTMEQRDEHMIMDCDVAAELLAAYLEELGLRTQIQTGYQDNGDGTLVQAELHGIVRITLPDGGVLYADATPSRFANDEERQIWAGIGEQRDNPLAAPPKTLEDHRTHRTDFEEQVATLHRQLAPLSDADRVAVYGVMLRDLSANLAHLTDTQAYLFDYVYKELLYHRGPVPAYPPEVFRRIQAPQAKAAAALDVNLTRETPLVRMHQPVEGAIHLLPREVALPDGVFKKIIDGTTNLTAGFMDDPALAGYRLLEAYTYVTGVTGGPEAELRLKPEKGEEVQGLLLGNTVLTSPGRTWLDPFMDQQGMPHALATREQSAGTKEVYLDSKRLTLPLAPGEKLLRLFPAVGHQLTAAIHLEQNGEQQDAILLEGKILRDVQGVRFHETSVEEGVLTFRTWRPNQHRVGFVAGKTLIDRLEGEELISCLPREGKVLVVTVSGRWGWYRGGKVTWGGKLRDVAPDGRLSKGDLRDVSADGRDAQYEQVLYTTRRNVAFFEGDRLVDSVTIGGTSYGIRFVHPRQGGRDQGRLLELEGGRRYVVYAHGRLLLAETQDGVPLKKLEEWNQNRLLGLDEQGRVHLLLLGKEGLLADRVMAEGIETMVLLDSLKGTRDEARLLVGLPEKQAPRLLVLDLEKQNARLWETAGPVQPDWQESLHNDMPAHILHEDGTVSANVLTGDGGVSEKGAILFHGVRVTPGETLQALAQRFFPKQTLGKDPHLSLKIASLVMVDGSRAGGGKVIFAGRLEGTPRVSFFLTSDGIMLVEGNLYEEGSGRQIWQAFFGEKGEVLVAKKLQDTVSKGLDGPQIAKVVGAPGKEVLLAQATMQNIWTIRAVGGGYLLTGTLVHTDGGNVYEHQGVVFQRGETQEVVDNIFGEEAQGYVADGLHDVVAEVDGAGRLTVESTAYHRETGKGAKFVYREGVWRRVRERGAVDLAKELFALLPRGAVLRQAEAVADPTYAQEVQGALRDLILGRGGSLTVKEATALGASLRPAHLRALRPILESTEARDFVVRYLLPRSDLLLLETGATLPDLVRRMSEAELRESFTKALRTWAGEREGW